MLYTDIMNNDYCINCTQIFVNAHNYDLQVLGLQLNWYNRLSVERIAAKFCYKVPLLCIIIGDKSCIITLNAIYDTYDYYN